MKFTKDGKARTPIYATEGSAGADLSVFEHITIEPHESKRVNIGIHFEIPENFFGMVVPRSSLYDKTGLILTNSVGIIDSDYRGPISMNLYNTSAIPVTLEYGTRIGQIIFIPFMQASFQQCLALSETPRGSGGYGSTDAKSNVISVNPIKYITSPNELPQNVHDFIRALTNSISALHYQLKLKSSDNEIFINETMDKFCNRIDKDIDNYLITIGYALKENK